MSNKQHLENIKKLREITGVGFKDCKLAIDKNNGDINKSIEYLRKKGNRPKPKVQILFSLIRPITLAKK